MNIQGFISCLIGIVLIYIFVYYRKQKIVEGLSLGAVNNLWQSAGLGSNYNDRDNTCKKCKEGVKDKWGDYKEEPIINGGILKGQFHEILKCMTCGNAFSKYADDEKKWTDFEAKILSSAKFWENNPGKWIRNINFK